MGGHADGDAVGTQHQKGWHLGWQTNGLLQAPVIRIDELRDFGVEERLLCQFGQAAFDVTGSGCRQPCDDAAEVALAVDEVFLIGEDGQCPRDGGVAVRMVVHGVANHARDLVEASVIDFVEAVKNAALNGLQAVIDIWDGPVAHDIRGVLDIAGGIEIAQRLPVVLRDGYGLVCRTLLIVVFLVDGVVGVFLIVAIMFLAVCHIALNHDIREEVVQDIFATRRGVGPHVETQDGFNVLLVVDGNWHETHPLADEGLKLLGRDFA